MLKFRTYAAAILVTAAVSGSGTAVAEQIGTFPVSAGQLSTEGTYFSDNDPGDFVLRDASTNLVWKFRSADASFYQLLTDLDRVSDGNVTQFAFVGNPPGQAAAAHATWVAPMSSNNQPSQFPGTRLPDGAVAFNVQALTVQQAPAAQSFVLTDGVVTVAEAPRYEDGASLELLKQMLQTNSLNVVWQQPGSAVTPVGDHGPVSVFLKIDGTASAGGKPQNCAAKWWSLKCWMGS